MNQKGFTITELLVVIFIIGLLSSGVLLSHRGINRKYSLDQGIQLMLSDLRKAQHMAMNGVGINNPEIDCGYGLVINSGSPTSYLFYADKHASNCDLSDNKYTPGLDASIQVVTLANDIIIDSVSNNPLDILFKYPEPTAHINQSSAAGVSGTITLKDKGSIETHSININTAGLIQGN